MANYLATDTDLTAVANAIRTKGGTSAQMAFPTGFVDAVNAISKSNLEPVAVALLASNITTTQGLTNFINALYADWETLHIYLILDYNNTFVGEYKALASVWVVHQGQSSPNSKNFYRYENGTSTVSTQWRYNINSGATIKVYDVTNI